MRKALGLLVAMVALCPAVAQQSLGEIAAQNKAAAEAKKAASSAPSSGEVMKLFGLLQIEKTMSAVIAATKEQSMEFAGQMLHERMPDATDAQKKQFQAMIDEEMRQALGPEAIREMLEATVPVYQRHLTKGDLDAMIAFYSSPVGQKILQEQPAMVQESMEASAGIQQRIARTMFQKIDQRVQQMMEEEKKAAKP